MRRGDWIAGKTPAGRVVPRARVQTVRMLDGVRYLTVWTGRVHLWIREQDARPLP